MTGDGGGYILAASHTIPPETPMENIFAMYHEAGVTREEAFDRAARSAPGATAVSAVQTGSMRRNGTADTAVALCRLSPPPHSLVAASNCGISSSASGTPGNRWRGRKAALAIIVGITALAMTVATRNEYWSCVTIPCVSP